MTCSLQMQPLRCSKMSDMTNRSVEDAPPEEPRIGFSTQALRCALPWGEPRREAPRRIECVLAVRSMSESARVRL
jgi:hypothetical protein